MKGYLRVGKVRVLGAPLFLHWGAILAIIVMLIATMKIPFYGIVTATSYFAIIAVHEFGHALFARYFRCRIIAIRIGFFHGNCEYEEPFSEKENILIAWGGVVAQATIAIPIVLLSAYTPLGDLFYFGPIAAFLGYINLMVAVFNILPINGFDGEKAWNIVPVLLRRS